MPPYSGVSGYESAVVTAKKWFTFGVSKLKTIPEQTSKIVQACSSPDTIGLAADGRVLNE
jgi:hypothetical protein